MTTVAMFKGDKEQRFLTGRQRSDDCIEHGLSPSPAALAETNNNTNAVVLVEGMVPPSPYSESSPPWPILPPQHRNRRRGRNNTLCIIAVAVIAVAVLIASVGYAVGTTISKRNNALSLSEANGGISDSTSESATTTTTSSNGDSDGVAVQLERPKDRAPDSDSTTTTTQSLFGETIDSFTSSILPTSAPTKVTVDVSSWVNAFNTQAIDVNIELEVATTTSTQASSQSPSESPSFTPSSSIPTTTPTDSFNLFNSLEIGEKMDTFFPSHSPSRYPTSRPVGGCFTNNTYDAIDEDIEILKNEIGDDTTRSHFLGGIVRLVAHDFMDYDQNNVTDPMGSDGCFDPDHEANSGLPESVWCDTCSFKLLYEAKYTHVSRADFWVAAANAVIRQTSIDNGLDLRDIFVWGRVDADTCVGSGDRLPVPGGCDEVEGVFLTKMGLVWRDAVALMGAHTLGRGQVEFSGHEGTWVDTDGDAQRFDKQYYEEMYLNSWRPRNMGESNQDWTTGRSLEGGNTRMMLNTDICLVYDIDVYIDENLPCCTRTGAFYTDGEDQCVDVDAAARSCPMYSQFQDRWEARQAVGEMLGGDYPNSNNEPFYTAFTEAWGKATTVGQSNLSLLSENCE